MWHDIESMQAFLPTPWSPGEIISQDAFRFEPPDLNPFMVLRRTRDNLRPESADHIFLETYQWVFYGNPLTPSFFDDFCTRAGWEGSRFRAAVVAHQPGIHRRYDHILFDCSSRP